MMNFYRFSAPLAAVAALASASCSSSASSSPASVYLTSTLGASTDPAVTGTCNINEAGAAFWMLGTPGDPVPTGTDGVDLACAVSPNASGGYDVNVQLTMGEQYGITMGGSLTDSPGTSQGGFTANFNRLNSGSYNETDCTVTLTTGITPPITGGRVWGTLNCPQISDPGNNLVCAATATFILQNCSE